MAVVKAEEEVQMNFLVVLVEVEEEAQQVNPCERHFVLLALLDLVRGICRLVVRSQMKVKVTLEEVVDCALYSVLTEAQEVSARLQTEEVEVEEQKEALALNLKVAVEVRKVSKALV